MSSHSNESMVAGGNGHLIFSDEQWAVIIKHLGLSRREAEVVNRIFDGMKEAAIARDLGISPHTVHTHIERLYSKLGIHDRCEALLRIFEAYIQTVGRTQMNKP